ncbi:MAG TPA: hypothetical protein VH721_06330 [Gaiellaceae bacterium]
MSDVTSNLSERELADLCAYADGTLPPERRAAVEARVEASPELQELVARQRRALVATGSLSSDEPSDSLRASVEAQRRASASRRRIPSLVPRAAIVVGAAALLFAGVLLVTGGPTGPTVAEAARLAASAPSGPPPSVRAGDETKLAADVEGVAFPNLSASYGWRAVGSRSTTLDGRDATVVFYAEGPKRLAYVIVAGEGLPRPADAPGSIVRGVRYQTFPVDGRLAVTWRRDGRTCVLVGPLSPTELIALASWTSDY